MTETLTTSPERLDGRPSECVRLRDSNEELLSALVRLNAEVDAFWNEPAEVKYPNGGPMNPFYEKSIVFAQGEAGAAIANAADAGKPSANTQLRLENEALRKALGGVLRYEKMRAKASGYSAGCTCMWFSPTTDRAYAAGVCRHQIARALLATEPTEPETRKEPLK